MYKTLTIILLALPAIAGHTQNIYSALHLNEQRDYKTRRPKRINVTNIFFLESGKKTEKSIKIFDEAGMLLVEDRLDENGETVANLTYVNDTSRRIILSRTITRKTAYGFTRDSSFYSYDPNGYLIRITDKDAKGNILLQTDLVNNDKGYPVKLLGHFGNGTSYGGEEIATYLYETNKAVTSVLKDGEVLSTDTIEINFNNAHLHPSESSIYNEKGDPIRYESKNPDGTRTPFECQYRYDSFGNCLEEIIYKVYTTPKGKQKKEIDRIFRKTYSYQ